MAAPISASPPSRASSNLRPFPAGTSGNPRGRPKRDHDIAALAREYTRDAIRVLADITNDSKAPPSARVAAASALLDRGWGKAPQSLDVGHKLSIGEEFDLFIRSLQEQRLNRLSEPALPSLEVAKADDEIMKG